MRKYLAVLLTVLLVMMAVTMTTASAAGKISQDDNTAKLIQRISDLQNKYEINKTQWYDIYKVGLALQTDAAGKLIIDARSALVAGNAAQAGQLLDQAEKMLNTYTSANLPQYKASTPLADPKNLGNIHLGALDDIKALSLYNGAIPRWNYWYNFVGAGNDGNQYMAYAFVNHHGTGKITPPTVFAWSSSDKPDVVYKTEFSSIPSYSEVGEKIVWQVQENGKTLRYEISQGKAYVEYKDDSVKISSRGIFEYSFWYNKNQDGGALMMPGAVMAGFEQPGRGEATFDFADKTITCKNGFAEQENLFCGGPKSADYRSALIKYGNEWWVPFNADQVSGIICMTGSYRDGGVYYKGKYYVISTFDVTPDKANESFFIDIEFGEDVKLHIKATMWGWDPKLYEHWGSISGNVNGEKLTNGYVWLEHIPQGGVNNSPPTASKVN